MLSTFVSAFVVVASAVAAASVPAAAVPVDSPVLAVESDDPPQAVRPSAIEATSNDATNFFIMNPPCFPKENATVTTGAEDFPPIK